jgi:hypothetical protein
VKAVNRAFPEVAFEAWTRCERLLPHAQACTGFIEQWNFDFSEGARLLDQAGSYVTARAQYLEAEPFLQRSLAIREGVLGSEHPETAETLNNLAEQPGQVRASRTPLPAGAGYPGEGAGFRTSRYSACIGELCNPLA